PRGPGRRAERVLQRGHRPRGPRPAGRGLTVPVTGGTGRRQPGPLRVLGVDPGLTRCGIAVVDVAPNRTATLVGVTVDGTGAEQSLYRRVLAIDEAMDEWLDRHTPDHVAVERMFAQHNTPTIMGTAQASGVAIAAAARRGIPVA